MKERIIGQVHRVNGPVIEADGITDARMLELVRVGESRLVGEVLKLSGNRAVIQVYEDTTGSGSPGQRLRHGNAPVPGAGPGPHRLHLRRDPAPPGSPARPVGALHRERHRRGTPGPDPRPGASSRVRTSSPESP
ncbi:MAG: hypothetical protein M0C28_43485 [Candidatus Moduliflexus flocculans]|nr:hypothetical protein [Candidatus Moduliflexus flocculans]